MKCLIKCDVCGETFWVRGQTPRPNEYCAHEEADYDECCEHLQEDWTRHTPIDFDPGD